MAGFGHGSKLIVAVSLVLCGLSAASGSGGDFATQAGHSGDGSTIHYVGIIGEVVRPGVYEFDTPAPSLVDVIARTGGLTRSASGNVRIVRHERADQQTFYSASSRFVANSGDLLIVDSFDGANGNMVQFGSGTQGDSLARENGRTAAQIGFVGLVERPVVEKIRGEDATLGALLARLGQPRDLASFVNVIRPVAHSLHDSMGIGTERGLPSGTVLIFDPARVVRQQSWNFTEPYRLESTARSGESGPPPAPETAAAGGTIPVPKAADRGYGKKLDGPQLNPATPAGTKKSVALAIREPEPSQTAAPQAGSMHGISPQSLTLQTASRPSVSDPDALDPMADFAPPENFATIISRFAPADASGSGLSVKTKSLSADAGYREDHRQPTYSSRPERTAGHRWLWVIAAVVLLVGMGLFRPMYRTWSSSARRLPVTAERVSKPNPRYHLDALINDELPFVEEAVEPSGPLVFHAPLKDLPPMRVDAAQAARAPHFTFGEQLVASPTSPSTDRTPQAGRRVYRADPAATKVSSAASATSPQSRTRTQQKSRHPVGLLERVLMRVHGAGQS